MSQFLSMIRLHGSSVLGIGLMITSLAGAFAWLAGWAGPARLTSDRVLAALAKEAPQPFPAGFRRAHGKGMCFTGQFTPTAQAAELSSARVLSEPSTPVVGRFSLGSGDPHAADNTSHVLSLALQLKDSQGTEWRMAMVNEPFFPTATVAGLLAMGEAFAPDATTDLPVPARVEAFYAAHPQARKYLEWSEKAPWASSFAVTRFNSINTFVFISKRQQKRFVRWALHPRLPFKAWPAGAREKADAQSLFDDLPRKLADKHLVWDLVVTVAEPSDPVLDPSRPWPDNRQRIKAGTLTVSALSDQATGACRDINYDPTIVPHGIEISDDPILHARSGTYAASFNLRQRENGDKSSGKAVTP